MSEAHDLLRRVRLRIAAATAVEDLQVGAAVGAGAALALLAARRLGAPVPDSGTVALISAGAAAAVPLAGLLLRRDDERALAARADERLGLRERLSTALWCESGAAASPLAGLVVADANATAAHVARRDLARAFRPRVLRRPLVAAASLAAATFALVLWNPAAEAVESPAAKAARLAEADRIAQVARKLEDEARRVAAEAERQDKDDLARLAREVREATRAMQQDPPPKEEALSKLNRLAEQAQSEVRRRAGLRAPAGTPEASDRDRALGDLLRALSQAGLESLQKDLSEMERRLQEGAGGKEGDAGGDRPSAEELRSLAERVDALRRAMQAAAESGAGELEKKLRPIGNEDLLEKIAERLREIASKMEQRGYEGLDSEDTAQDLDVGEMTREELEELLRELEQMADMEDLAELLRQGGAEARGGKRIRIPRPGGSGGT